jgi:hypothetical protein
MTQMTFLHVICQDHFLRPDIALILLKELIKLTGKD